MLKEKTVFIVIILLAILLRVYALDRVPPALFGDEVDVGYQAYSLSQTGKDLYGRFLPFYLSSLSESRASLFIYSAVPFVSILGLNEWGVRIPAVFWAIVSIIGVYLVARRLFNWQVAVMTILLLSISPWHLQYSRAAFEVTMLLSFIVWGTLFFLKSKDRIYYLLPAALLFGLTPYIYSTAVVFTPLWVLSLIIIYKKDLLAKIVTKNNRFFLGLTIAIIFLATIPAMWGIKTGEAKGRFQVISIFQDSVLLDKINLARRGQEYFTTEGEVVRINPQLESFFHNKATVFTQVFFLNYLRSFSFDFLFAKGDSNFRHSIFEMGELYAIELLTLLIGVGFLMVRTEKKIKLFLLSWLLLAPIPASLTHDGGYHATRLFLMLPPLTLLNALGWMTIFNYFKNEVKLFSFRNSKAGVVIVGLLLIFLIEVIFYFHRYYAHYPVESWRWWHVGYKEAMSFIDKNEDSYQRIVINNSYEPALIRYLFYTQYEPKKFHSEFTIDQPQQDIIEGIDGFSLGSKLIFGQINEKGKKDGGLEKIMKPGMLYLASARDEADGDIRTYNHQNYTILKTIVSPTGDPIFYILAGK